MIEIRPLNRIEVNLLIAEALEDETRNLVKFLKENDYDAYEFLNQPQVVYKFGLIIDKRPIYFAHIYFDGDRYELWTVINKDTTQQKTLYKYSKKALEEALKQFSPIYATMEKHLVKNLRWTQKLGFKPIYQDGNIVTLKIGA